MLIVYILSLSLGAGVVGSFCRDLLARLGFIPDFVSGLYITLGVAGVYAALQLLYLTAMRMYQPTRAPASLGTEAVSNLAALLLIPYLLGVELPVASESVQRAAPLIFAGLFGGVHLVLKLATFYASLAGAKDVTRPILAWLGGAVAAGLVGVFGLSSWQTNLAGAREVVGGKASLVESGTVFARAKIASEGATLTGTIEEGVAPALALRFGNLSKTDRFHEPIDRVYVSIRVEGADTKTYETSARLPEQGWAEIRIPHSAFPKNPREYAVRWTHKSEPNWQEILGLQPIVYNTRPGPGEPLPPPLRVYVSGAFQYAERPATKDLNVVVVLIDGLAANHMALFGYDREVTPSLDRLGYRAQIFPNAASASRSAAPAMEALLTGRDVTHLEAPASASATLAQTLRASGYAVGAFLERAENEAIEQAAWLEGFEFLDLSGSATIGETADSGRTLADARGWIADHHNVPFFCLIRSRAVAELPSPDAYKTEFVQADGTTRGIDVFDNALVALDRELGALIKYVRDHDTRNNTVIVVTAPYGHTFSLGASKRFLDERTDRVPLILFVPGRRPKKYPGRVALEDVAVTLAAITGKRLPGAADGRNLLR